MPSTLRPFHRTTSGLDLALPYGWRRSYAAASFGDWFGLLVVAFLNGAIRVLWLTPAFGDSTAHLLSAPILSAVVIVVAWSAIVWLHPHSANEALLIGDEWVLLTIAFEFIAGYYLFGSSWQALLAQYDVSQGQLWELVLVTMLIAPVAAAFGHHLVGRHRIISSTRQVRFRR